MEASGTQWWRPGLRLAPGMVVALAAAGLLLLGLLVLYSAGMGENAGASIYMRKQAVWACAGLAAACTGWLISLDFLRKFWWLAAAASLALLVAVLIPGIGEKINGARRWIDLGPMNMQVSDFAKIGLILVMADYLGRNQRRMKEFWSGYIAPLAIVGTAFALVLAQPDYGTALLMGVTGGVMVFLAGARMLYLIPTAIAGVGLFSVAVYLNPVRLQRVLSFLDIEANKADGAYQLWQGILAFGAGGVSGVGLGNGRQQMAFLPEAHTDFIFAIIGEELGFVWTSIVVLLFLLILVATMMRLRQAPNLYQFLLVSGALLLVSLQALINFGVVTGCLPTKGMSLPLISYGGSNLVATCFLIGVILNAFRSWGKTPRLQPREDF